MLLMLCLKLGTLASAAGMLTATVQTFVHSSGQPLVATMFILQAWTASKILLVHFSSCCVQCAPVNDSCADCDRPANAAAHVCNAVRVVLLLQACCTQLVLYACSTMLSCLIILH